jgi:hypothetical protein
LFVVVADTFGKDDWDELKDVVGGVTFSATIVVEWLCMDGLVTDTLRGWEVGGHGEPGGRKWWLVHGTCGITLLWIS